MKEFREFVVRGSAVDMAVGIVIGASFGKIITSLVNDVIMPPIGLVLGGVDFKNLRIVLKEAAGKTPEVSLNYGLFINTLLDFLIIAFCVFMTVKVFNHLRRD